MKKQLVEFCVIIAVWIIIGVITGVIDGTSLAFTGDMFFTPARYEAAIAVLFVVILELKGTLKL